MDIECITLSESGIAILNGDFKKRPSDFPKFVGPYGFELCQEATGKWNIRDSGCAYYAADGVLGETVPSSEKWKVIGGGKEPPPHLECTYEESQRKVSVKPTEEFYDDGAEEEDYDSGTEEYWEHYMSQYCRLNDIVSVKKCIQEGCPVNIEDPTSHFTPLRIACEEGHYELAQYLLENGGEIDPLPGVDYNCLQVAVMKKREKIVRLLLDQVKKNNIANRADPDGDYPVHACALRNLLDILKLLVEEGNANLTVINAHRVTPLHLACQSPSTYQMAHYILSKLNKNTYAINAQDENGETPLHYAARNDCDAVIILLNDNDADCDVRNNQNQTPYDVAVENGFRRSMDILSQQTFFSDSTSCQTPVQGPVCENEVPMNVFDYQGEQWGYFVSANHPRPPIRFYAQPVGEQQWFTYNTLQEASGKQYYQCEETKAYCFNDPRGSDYFACPVSTYQAVAPPVESAAPAKSKEEDAKMKKKLQRLQSDVERYKKAIQESQKKHEEELDRLEEKQTDELRQRDETISKYFTELNVLKLNTIKPERENELLAEIQKCQAEEKKQKDELTTSQRDINVRNLKIKKLMKDAEVVKEKYTKEKADLKTQFDEEKAALMKDFEAKCALISKEHIDKAEITEAVETAEKEKQAALEELKKKSNLELNKYKIVIKKLNEEIAKLKEEVASLHDKMKNSEGDIESKIEEARRAAIQSETTAVQARLKEMEDLYNKEHELRKKLHNEIIELKGNIRVFCRVRPFSKTEIARGEPESSCSYPKDDNEKIIINKSDLLYTFEFDSVFGPASTQEEVFNEVSPFVTSALDGYNICIFAYGQTGSGKTFTMQGPDDNPGVNFKALNLLFETIQNSKDVTFTITLSVLEIYNETINDLLRGGRGADGATGLPIRQGPEGNFVEGLLKKEVTTYVEVIGILKKSQDNRSVGCHNLNEHSSRSHLIVIIELKGIDSHSGQTINSCINMVDLAGSERAGKTGATGDRLKEAQAINKSLSALGNVMQALGAKDKHIPYRNVKLTHLLQDSLSKHSKVLMFVNISPAPYNVSETLSSLQFAERCRNIELGRAVKNVT